MSDLNLAVKLILDSKEFKAAVTNAQRDIGGIGDASKKATAEAERGFGALNRSVQGIAGTMRSALAVLGTAAGAGSFLQTLTSIQDTDTRLKALTGTSEGYARATQFLTTLSAEHHKSMLTLADSYSRMLALEQAGIVTRTQAEKITRGMSDAQSATGASAEQLGQVMFGLAQGLSAGTLRAEELNQVTEPLPGLLQKLDQAAGLTAGGFRRMVVEGQVTSEMFADTLVKALQSYEGAAVRAGDNVKAKFADLESAYQRLVRVLEGPIAGPLTGLLSGLAEGIDAISGALGRLEARSDFLPDMFRGSGVGAFTERQQIDMQKRTTDDIWRRVGGQQAQDEAALFEAMTAAQAKGAGAASLDAIFAKYARPGIPAAVLKAIADKESALGKTTIRDSQGRITNYTQLPGGDRSSTAGGLMQITDSTLRDYGLRGNKYDDDQAVMLAAEILARKMAAGGGIAGGLSRYYGSQDPSANAAYAADVLKRAEKFGAIGYGSISTTVSAGSPIAAKSGGTDEAGLFNALTDIEERRTEQMSRYLETVRQNTSKSVEEANSMIDSINSDWADWQRKEREQAAQVAGFVADNETASLAQVTAQYGPGLYGTDGSSMQGEKSGIQGFVDQYNQGLGSMQQYTFTAVSSMQSAMSNFFEAGMAGTESLGAAFGQLARRIAADIAAAMVTKGVLQLLSLAGTALMPAATDFSGLSATAPEIGGGTAGLAFPGAGLASGGFVRGPGTATSDSIPARLSNGEFVVRAAAVRAVGLQTLHRMNSMSAPGFAAGGMVGGGAVVRGGDSISISVPLTVAGSGEPPADLETRASALQRQVRTAVEQVIAEEQRPGGILARGRRG